MDGIGWEDDVHLLARRRVGVVGFYLASLVLADQDARPVRSRPLVCGRRENTLKCGFEQKNYLFAYCHALRTSTTSCHEVGLVGRLVGRDWNQGWGWKGFDESPCV